ncbi:MAG: serine/threonine-protein kinase [Acidobacteriota bacterium]
MGRVGRYEIEKEIGRGAMGVVYVAHDPRVRRRVAIKTVQVPEGLDAGARQEYHERFLREAQSAGRLDHPAIVTIHDADEDADQGVSFIVMEYVEGRSLRAVLAGEGPLAPDRVLDLARQVAAALDVAHAAGVVHRDVKPANILVREADGAVKIADFGIARLSTSDLTRSGQSLGSPAYMSPEQLRGRACDGRSDLFSLGVILYEALCGSRPFAGDDLPALSYAVVHESPVPITRLRPALPAGLDRFFATALAKNPSHRFADGVHLVEALAASLATTPAEAMDDAAAATQVAAGPRIAAGPAGPLRPLLLRAAAVLIALTLGGWGLVALAGRATLVVTVRSSVESGRLVVRVDGDRVYTRPLQAKRKRVSAFGKKLMSWGQEEFDAEFSVRPGERTVEVELQSSEGEPGEREELALQFTRGESRTLKVNAGRKRGDVLQLRIE